MERQLAYVETIKSLAPIQGADRIEQTTILGWTLVVKKGEFKVGDKAVYIEVDAICPDVPAFKFLEPKKFRIKIQKIRGAYSYGIAFPLSVINEVDPSVDISKLKVGDDLTQILKITKYESSSEETQDQSEDNQVQLPFFQRKFRYWKWKLFGYKPVKNPGGFPSHLVPKTDETRVQKMGGLLLNKQGTLCYISEKIEGSSATFIYQNKKGNWLSKIFGGEGQFLACSRNTIRYFSDKKSSNSDAISRVMRKYSIEKKMTKLKRNLALQGEVIGADSDSGGKAIQGNIYNLKSFEIRFFSAWDIDNQKYLGYEELVRLLNQLDLPLVPVLETNVSLVDSIPHYIELSRGYSELNPKTLREGIVVRAMDSSFSFKAINPDYLLSSEL